VNRYFCDWSYDGTLDRIHHALYLQCREKLERRAGSGNLNNLDKWKFCLNAA
jgi:hypothetical protein